MKDVKKLGTEGNVIILQSSNVENKNVPNSLTAGIPIMGDVSATFDYSSMGGSDKTFTVTNTDNKGSVLWTANFTGTSGTSNPAILSLQAGTFVIVTVTQPKASNGNTNYSYTIRPLDVTQPTTKKLPNEQH